MFDCLLGRKFSARCKTSIKCVKKRIFLIRKKKLATLYFLKKDIADLLANGHNDVAFGRTEGLIAEMNRTSCYDMIEKLCEYAKKQLPCLQKQRECPQEVREALSTLIFAAARFSDLPELCDLRHAFTVRYGSTVESSINSEFVEKTNSKSFSMDRKLHLMRDIAQDFSINWDLEAFKYKMSTDHFKSAPGGLKKVEPLPIVNEDEPLYKPLNQRNEKAIIDVSNQEISSCRIREPEPNGCALKYSQREPKGVHVISSTNNDSLLDHVRKTKMLLATELENVAPYSTTSAVSLCKQKASAMSNVRQKCNEDEIQTDYQHVTRSAYGWQLKDNIDKPVNPAPPYAKPAAKNNVNHQDDCNEGVVNDKPLRGRQGSDSVGQVRQAVGQGKCKQDRANIKSKATLWKDDMLGDGKPKPRSVRSRHERPPMVPKNEPSCRRMHGVGQCTRKFEDSVDEEERVLDRLLTHYSKKRVLRTRKKVPPTDHEINGRPQLDGSESVCAPARAVSLPSNQVGPREGGLAKRPVHAISLQPDLVSPKGHHVHPKLPDYDELAARINALRNG